MEQSDLSPTNPDQVATETPTEAPNPTQTALDQLNRELSPKPWDLERNISTIDAIKKVATNSKSLVIKPKQYWI